MSEKINEKVTVLVVDDNQENLKVVSNFLKEKKYKIALAEDGLSALKILNSNKIQRKLAKDHLIRCEMDTRKSRDYFMKVLYDLGKILDKEK